ncbi:dTDP-4-dehydrorhamnose 3,5-epimerase [Sinimarinibacterium flocculans]|uniref:dTDP-4-dehydrorhamnose 3,5-epimerase n=1 Tax=Sinimarinibacterium flocculans TaxID=985250 RepID=A0A318EEB2_9GAMM|nr:dTDP-4-dehydrorhamnose 3,5-epimerase [Sinimarinibacterium flocculans]PXV66204.1 dTDP-4-dehydrorhamnose 3,5-epimerase [Sinimarinibacterium flocculans]
MQAIPTTLPDVLMLEPRVFGDERGFFMESFHAARFAELSGCSEPMVQDNHSRSVRGVLRGLHYQLPPMAQGKLVRVVSGEIYDVAVDIRRGSKTFGQWVGVTLSAENRRQLWVPPGFAHGFCVTSDTADVIYKVTAYYSPEHDRGIRWNDPAIGIAWPLETAPQLSPKDEKAPLLHDAEVF